LQRLALLESLRESKERARKLKLQAIAPGWNESGEVMQPTKTREKEKKEERGGELLMGDAEGGVGVESPKEMGEGTMGKMQRDLVMDEWLDKWDQGKGREKSGQKEEVDDLI